ncbi:MAG: hypothetical protein GXO87_02720 [Chlorobi bacterium]|nr:hypothetical protein [Chlorobiota bacterium]
MIKKLLAPLFFFILISEAAFAQGYYLRRIEGLPDTLIVKNPKSFYIPYYYLDVRSLGRGNTEIANGRQFNASYVNPAFLAEKQPLGGSIIVVAGVPPVTLDAASFLSNNIDQFKEGIALKNIWSSSLEYLANQYNPDAQKTAITKLKNSLKFPQQLSEKIIGNPDNSNTHGLNAFASANVFFDNWSFSFHAYGQSAFKGELGPFFTELLKIKLPEDLSNKDETKKAVSKFEDLLEYVVDTETGQVNLDALPAIYSFSFMDLLFTAGYGFKINDNFSVGANLKFTNRRFTAAKILAIDFGRIFEKAFKNFNTSIFTVTTDIGITYKNDSGFSAGFIVKNLLPLPSLNSSFNLDLLEVNLGQDKDQAGNPIVNADGDTALVSYYRKVKIEGPLKLATPVITSIGFFYPLLEDLDISLDITDVFEQTNFIDNYLSRVQLGVEYRYFLANDNLELAFRAGLFRKNPTLGFGAGILKIIRVDLAYYQDPIFSEKNIIGQISFTW